MPWQLTTPIDVGDLDENPYSQVKIIRMAHDSNRSVIAVDLSYGNTDGQGNWVEGVPPRTKPQSVIIQGADYAALVADSEASAAGEKLYEGVKAALYAFLEQKGFIGPGSVV